MTLGDFAEERERLARRYAGMSVGELEKIAQDEASLTEVAREVLASELSQRGLELDSDPAAAPSAEELTPVTLRKFRDLPEAVVAKSILDSAGIKCYLGDETTVRMDWLWSNLLGGVKLWVRRQDATAASELLRQDFSEGFDVEGIGEYKQPCCPSCQSSDISFEELNRSVAHPGLLLGLPIPLKRSGWLCHACGKTWSEDDEIAVPPKT